MRFIHNIEFIIRNLVDDEFKDKIKQKIIIEYVNYVKTREF